jgi:hypothetical protein
MPSVYNQCIVQWVDASGRPATSFWTTIDQTEGGAGAYGDVAAAAQDLADAAVVAVQFQSTLMVNNTPVTGDYQSCLDRAVILANIQTSNAPTRFEIPGPKADIFLPDHELVDMSDPRVVAFNAACSAVLGDTSGNAVGLFKRGIRARARGAS